MKIIDTIVYAGRTKDKDLLMNSSSGGAFTALSDFFLDAGNAIVCACYNYHSHVTEYKLIFDKKDRDAARGSKYMQSIPGTVFSQAEFYLKEHAEKTLLFVGMGCQAEGFRKYAEAVGLRDRVWIVDIICHGSPSPKIWKEYAEYLERKHHGSLKLLSFKDKRNGWKSPTAKVVINGKEILLKDYVQIFYNRCALRPSCHECPFATTERKIDITIGDFWGIEKKMADFYDPNGNSLFLIHTDRGMELFQKIKDTLEYRESNTIDCLQPNLEWPTPVSEKREGFWQDYQERGIEYIMKKYGTTTVFNKLKNKMIKIIRGGH